MSTWAPTKKDHPAHQVLRDFQVYQVKWVLKAFQDRKVHRALPATTASR